MQHEILKFKEGKGVAPLAKFWAKFLSWVHVEKLS